MEAQGIIEQVARAISMKLYGGYPVGENHDRAIMAQWETTKEVAREAIKAMREPTEAMMNAPANMPFRVVDVQFNQAHYSPRRLEWQAAIDAALNEQEKV